MSSSSIVPYLYKCRIYITMKYVCLQVGPLNYSNGKQWCEALKTLHCWWLLNGHSTSEQSCSKIMTINFRCCQNLVPDLLQRLTLNLSQCDVWSLFLEAKRKILFPFIVWDSCTHSLRCAFLIKLDLKTHCSVCSL